MTQSKVVSQRAIDFVDLVDVRESDISLFFRFSKGDDQLKDQAYSLWALEVLRDKVIRSPYDPIITANLFLSELDQSLEECVDEVQRTIFATAFEAVSDFVFDIIEEERNEVRRYNDTTCERNY